MAKYLTAPAASEKLPRGIPFIIGNEAAERFSFYGMRTILIVFMTEHLLNRSGELDTMAPEEAKVTVHLFVSGVYFTPILGALLSDIFLGKYRTILWLSIVYCLGHLALALDETRLGLMVGLSLIVIGAGGIKPCVSAHVGDQFGAKNHRLLARVFSWFYFSINLGAFSSSLLTPVLLEEYGPGWAFGVPGVLMFLATIIFWLGRNVFIHIPPGGMCFAKEAFSPDGIKAVVKLFLIYVFVAMFWALFDQTGSAWVLQAKEMDRQVFGRELLASQIQAANPALIMILIPIFSYIIYPLISSVFPLTPLRKISLGFFVTAAAFALSAGVQERIDAGETPHIIWQVNAYILITAAEVMVSITCLEFSYTQAPKRMKSFIMAIFLLSVTLGNLFTAGVNQFIQNEDGTVKLEGASYYWFFTGAMFVTAILFVFVAALYKERTYIQDDSDSTAEPDAEAAT